MHTPPSLLGTVTVTECATYGDAIFLLKPWRIRFGIVGAGKGGDYIPAGILFL